MLHDVVELDSPSQEDIKMEVLKLNSAAKLFSEVLKLVQIRNSMSAERLNLLSILHVHKTFTDELDFINIAAEFACRNEKRRN